MSLLSSQSMCVWSFLVLFSVLQGLGLLGTKEIKLDAKREIEDAELCRFVRSVTTNVRLPAYG